MGKGNRDVLVLLYSAFEKTKLWERIFNKSHILPGQGKFLPLFSIWPGSYWTGIADGTSWGKSLQQFRNPEGSLENDTVELTKSPVGGRQITDLAGWQTEISKVVDESGVQRSCWMRLVDHFFTALLNTWKVRPENKPEWPHWPAILMAALQQVEWIMEGRMICFVQVIAG